MVHFTHNYLLNPPHLVTVNVIGAGGNGSQMISGLARLNLALTGLGHPGLHVRLWDNDTVSPANAGRQLFSPADIGQYKSSVLITRINRFFGYDWEARAEKYNGQKKANITITCVDSAKARVMIGKKLTNHAHSTDPLINSIYWLDLGNSQKTGQVVLGTLQAVKQPSVDDKTKKGLPCVTSLFKNLAKIKEENQGPSCSLAEALTKQDLFINSTLAQFGCNLLWKLFREGMIRHHGCYVNVETMSVNAIKIS